MGRPVGTITCHPERKHEAKGLCASCYQRLNRNGSLKYRKSQFPSSHSAIHVKMKRHKKKLACSNLLCDGSGKRLEFALKHDPSEVNIDKSGLRWSSLIDDYIVLCSVCHKQYDRMVTA